MSKHKWKFKAHFRREAYGWKGTSLAAKRMREAVSEIKKTAKKEYIRHIRMAWYFYIYQKV